MKNPMVSKILGAGGIYGVNAGIRNEPYIAALLYLGFLVFIGFSYKSGQTELYIFTIRKESHPYCYWITMVFFSIAAICLGICMTKML